MKMTVASFASRLEEIYGSELVENFRKKFPSPDYEITSNEGFGIVSELLSKDSQNQLPLSSLMVPTSSR